MAGIKITVKNYRCFEDANPVTFTIGDGFTAFVGPNNCGKSSLLRMFHELRIVLNNCQGIGNLNQMLARGRFGIDLASTYDPQEIFCDRNERGITLEIEPLVPGDPVQGPQALSISCERFPSPTWGVQLFSGGKIMAPVESRVEINNIGTSVAIVTTVVNGNAINERRDAAGNYVPIMSAVKSLADSIYVGPFRNAINEGSASYYDLQVGSGFISEWHQWKTGPVKQRNMTIARITEDIRSIFEFSSLEINASEALRTLQIVVDGRPYKLRELGAGIAQFIFVFANAAIRRPSYIFIDEPELGLYPSLQVSFLTSLASYASEGIVYATHSIGLARATADRL